jgi:hypothetical protein
MLKDGVCVNNSHNLQKLKDIIQTDSPYYKTVQLRYKKFKFSKVQGLLRSWKSALLAYCVKEGMMKFWMKKDSISQCTKLSYAINIL